MIGNIKNVINQFSLSTLEGIQKIGRYEIRGFRIGGPKSLLKEQRLKTELSKKNDILEIIKKYADQQLNEGHLDNTWTFVKKIDSATIKKKLNTSKTEYVLLELISNDRYDVINDLFNHVKYISTEDSQTNNDFSEKSIDDYKKTIQRLENTIKYNENQNNDLLKKNNILKNKLNEEKKKNEINEIKLVTIEKEIKSLKEENKNIKTNNQLINIVIIGGEKIKKWFEENNRSDRYNFTFFSIGNEEISSFKKTNELWIIKPFISNNDKKLIKQNSFIALLNKLQKVFIFKHLEEVKKHMDYQEAIK